MRRDVIALRLISKAMRFSSCPKMDQANLDWAYDKFVLQGKREKRRDEIAVKKSIGRHWRKKAKPPSGREE